MVRVNSVVVVDLILSSCGLKLLPSCVVRVVFISSRRVPLYVMSSRLLSVCSGGLLSSCEAVSSLVGVWVVRWEGTFLLLALELSRC